MKESEQYTVPNKYRKLFKSIIIYSENSFLTCHVCTRNQASLLTKIIHWVDAVMLNDVQQIKLHNGLSFVWLVLK